MLFVRLYFLRTFFTRLQRKLRRYEDSFTYPAYDAPQGITNSVITTIG